jgi:hypothetical protein
VENRWLKRRLLVYCLPMEIEPLSRYNSIFSLFQESIFFFISRKHFIYLFILIYLE